jgi:hypothetical protein
MAEWVTVHEEAGDQIIFDTIGDQFVGTYFGSEVVDAPTKENPDNTFVQLKFKNDAGVFVTNAGYELEKAFGKIEPGSLVRITLIKFLNVNQASPMKSFRVDVAK